MDYGRIAREVIENVGGKSNIKSVTHCATRLRFQLKNNDLRNEDVISDIEGVKGVFLTQSQFQIIFGSGLVNLICDEVQKQLGTLADTKDEPEEKKGNPIQRFVKMLSDIFVPIIPAIVAGGLLMGLNNLLTSALIDGRSVIELYPQWQGLAAAINTFANAPFTFLPVLIGFSAARKFGGNAFLGAAMGMIMVHPDLLNAYQIGLAEPPVWNIFGFEIAAIGYQGTVLPVLAVSWILANIEKRLHKVTPSWLDNLSTPLLSILITSFLTFICVGPVLREAGNLLAAGITWVYNVLGPVGGALFGFAYAPITMTGMHHSFIAIETQLIAESAVTGGSFIFTTASMNNVAQGAAVIAVLLLTKNDKMKSICSASGISALLGITEPAMFGVTLKLKYPFYAAMIGSAAGSAYLAWTKTLAQALGAAGLPGFISMKPEHYLNFAVGLLISIGLSFALTWIFWKKFGLDKDEANAMNAKAQAGAGSGTLNPAVTGNAAGNIEEYVKKAVKGAIGPAIEEDGAETAACDAQHSDSESANHNSDDDLYSPMNGEVLPVEQSEDPMFASKMLGDGIAVNPSDGTVYAPCDGTLTLLYETKHALGITTDSGIDLLIHVGIDTVQMKGEGFETFAAQGDRIRKGQKLLAVDLDLVKEKGYSAQTMMILPQADGITVNVFPAAQAGPETKVMTLHR
ncbi:PTS beta-glucoside transporter subunit IIBCA [Clostridium sp. MCC353]|uniref:sucrose-specific PTS transporter subunit IIBC n=1 Tax=Clostridium sp. MCC353 TaxID=2592646 RepID=UPI001C033C19|nr:sucrose-specific PTS transporter subunit IIBC [Clostridium sp. MCC353]MBT9778547.1 PTS beta-glucoside transporter subunit IIBCA [Clostridium sp. MCC353]